MADFKIKKGYNVPISGEAKKEIAALAHPAFVGVCPNEFPGLKPKLTVAEDDIVKVGTPLFYDKKATDVRFLSPASGRIASIKYGPRRVIEEIVIRTDAAYEYEEFKAYSESEIRGLDRSELKEALMKGGMWPLIRQRPFNKIADPEAQPKALFINCMDTAPLANDPAFSLKEKGAEFAMAADALKILCDQVHVVTGTSSENDVFRKAKGVSYHRFSGKHPAGLVGTHINKVSPINRGEVVWYLNARDAVLVGTFLKSGRFPIERVIAVAGPGAAEPGYFRTQLGIRIQDALLGPQPDKEERYISGNVLTGAKKSKEGFLGYYDDLISAIPEGREQHFLGWMSPGAGKASYTRVFFSGFLSGKKYDMNTNLNGGHRAIIQSGVYDRVVALDIYPEFLVKATIAEDIDQMERLGILECDPEDFALCTYVCPSKTEVSQIIAKGLELMEKEG